MSRDEGAAPIPGVSGQRTLRIGIVCPYAWDVPGGVQAHVRDLAETLMDFGHFVRVITPVQDPSLLPDYADDGGRPRSVPYNGSVARLTLGMRATNHVRRWIREGEFDVVHVHEPLAPSLSLLTCWAAEGPIVATWHSSIARSRALSVGYYIAQTAMEKVSARIAVSEYARRTLVDHIGGDAVLIPNGVKVADFAEVAPLEPRDGRRVLFLGRTGEPRKGLSVLLRSWPGLRHNFPDLKLVIVGAADEADVLAQLPAEDAASLEFLGPLSDHGKARALRSADVYVAPNTGGESFGIVLLEAMSAGTPVVASDLPAFRRVLDDGRTGAVFINEDSSDLTRVLSRVLSSSAERESLAAAGSARAAEFDWSHIAADVVAVYDSVVQPGEVVKVDLRGQLMGRWGQRGSTSGVR
ncbi:MAG: glycosyltransferase family 4 protein [Candidatus Nanopelagicales bacterium]|nr:glycosyltransferase family 4 protein [Candidatus Nanopelagicales bacterium]